MLLWFVNSARFFRALSAMRPRPGVPLTSSISLRLFFSRIRSFVFKPLRTLPSSVSRKSCVCNSYANCRVDINYSQSGTHPSHHHRHPRSFFSCTYELPILYTFCFDIHAYNGGCTPFLAVSIVRPALAFCFHLLAHSFAVTKNSTRLFSSVPHSLDKTHGWWGLLLAIPPAGSILWVAP